MSCSTSAGGRRSRSPTSSASASETLVYLSAPGDLAAYEELRAGFTAAVSHELRTPLARLLALLESALLPGADQDDLIEQAKREVEQIGELIDDVLFLSELESGRAVVALGSISALPVIDQVVAELRPTGRAAAGARPQGRVHRLVRPAATARGCSRWSSRTSSRTRSATRAQAPTSRSRAARRPTADALRRLGRRLRASPTRSLPRLFERFYRADRARVDARHRPRPRDRQARRRRSRRHGRGDRHARRRPRPSRARSRPGSDRQPGRADPLHARAQGVLRAVHPRVLERRRRRAARAGAVRALPPGRRRADRPDQGARAHGRRPHARDRQPDQQDVRHPVRPRRHLPARRARSTTSATSSTRPPTTSARGASPRCRPTRARSPTSILRADDPARRGRTAPRGLQGLEPPAERAARARGRGRPPVPRRRRRALPLGRRRADR